MRPAGGVEIAQVIARVRFCDEMFVTRQVIGDCAPAGVEAESNTAKIAMKSRVMLPLTDPRSED